METNKEFIGTYVQITVSGMDFVESLVPSSREVRKVQSYRMSILKELYNKRAEYWGLNMWELGTKLALTEEATDDVIHYLEVWGLVESPALGPFIKITTNGIDFFERSQAF